MPWVTDEQVAAVRERERQLGELFQSYQDRLTTLENKPSTDEFTRQWQTGRDHVRRLGYSAQDVERLEGFMQREGVVRHDFAARLDPVGPTGKLQLIDGLPEDERKLLMQGDEESFLRLAITRSLSGE